MSATLMDGKVAAEKVYARLEGRVATLRAEGITPGVAFVRVGGDPASASYVRSKQRAAKRLGILGETFELPGDAPASELESRLASLNADPRFHGVLLQLPLPPHLAADERRFLDLIDPARDVDGFTSHSLGLLAAGTPRFVPATPLGIIRLMELNGVDPSGKHAVVVGRSVIVGRPVSLLLCAKAAGANATVTVVHTGTPDPAIHTREADILIVAAGSPRMLGADMVRDGAVVVDVGINRVEDPGTGRGYRLVGDVDFDAVREKASLITPVPGGVGLMTVAMLMENTVRAAKEARDRS